MEVEIFAIFKLASKRALATYNYLDYDWMCLVLQVAKEYKIKKKKNERKEKKMVVSFPGSF